MNRVKQHRESRGWRKEDLASRAGISLSYVNLLESKRPPTPGLDRARRIADVLGVEVDAIFPPAR